MRLAGEQMETRNYARFATRLISQMIAAMTATIQSRCSATDVTARTTRAKTQMTMTSTAIQRRECFTASHRSSARGYVYGI